MQRVDAAKLRQKISSEEFDYTLLSSALANYSGLRQKINELLKAKVIIRVKKGLYVFGPGYSKAPLCKEVLANQIYGPSCISLEYALAFHGLIPERVETITSVTPKRDKQFQTPIGRFTYRFLGQEKYPLGIEQVWIDKSHPALMASPEKALCDYIALNKIPTMKTKKDAESFLEFDLRIDRSHWSHFNKHNLQKLNDLYKDKNINVVQKAIAERL